MCCTHAKKADKRNIKGRSLSEFEEDTINNSRKHTTRSDGLCQPRRRTTQFCNLQCDLKNINIHFGRYCLFVIPKDNVNLHCNHPQVLGQETMSHIDEEQVEQIKLMAHNKPTQSTIQAGMLELHNGDIRLTKKKVNTVIRKHNYKPNANSNNIPQTHLNSEETCIAILKEFKCRTITLKDISQYKSKDSTKRKKSSQTFDSGLEQ